MLVVKRKKEQIMRDSKKPTVISLSYDKTNKMIVINDLSGEMGIVPKDDAEGLLNIIKGLIENSQLPEFSLAQVTIGKDQVNAQGVDFTDINQLKQQGLQHGINFLLGHLQGMSNYKR